MIQIREYFHKQIRIVNSDAVALEKALEVEDYSQTDLDCSYHLLIGTSLTTQRLNCGLVDRFDTKLRLYFDSGECENSDYDKAYCQAIEIRNRLVNLQNINENDYMEEIVPVSILPSNAETNSKVFIFDINTKVRLSFDF